MIENMEISRRTWTAALKLAVVLSVVAALVAVAASTLADVPQVAIVLPVIVVAFVTSWIQTGRVRRSAIHDLLAIPTSH
jgi:flagellar biosynthesis protein FliQ